MNSTVRDPDDAPPCDVCGHIDPGRIGDHSRQPWSTLYYFKRNRGSRPREASAMATGRTLDLEHVRFHVGSCGWWAMVAGPGSRQTRGQLLQMLLRSTRYFAAPFLLGEFHHEADLGPHATALVRQEWFRVTRPGSEEPLSPQVVLFAAAAGVDLPNDPQESSDGRLPYLEFLDLFFTWLLPLGRASGAVRQDVERRIAVDMIGLHAVTLARIRSGVFGRKAGSRVINAQIAVQLARFATAESLIAHPTSQSAEWDVLQYFLERLAAFAKTIEFDDPPWSVKDAEAILERILELGYEDLPDANVEERDRPLPRLIDAEELRWRGDPTQVDFTEPDLAHLAHEAEKNPVFTNEEIEAAHEVRYGTGTPESLLAVKVLMARAEFTPRPDWTWALFVNQAVENFLTTGSVTPVPGPSTGVRPAPRGAQEILSITLEVLCQALRVRLPPEPPEDDDPTIGGTHFK